MTNWLADSRRDDALGHNGTESVTGSPVMATYVNQAPVDDGIDVNYLETGSVLSVYTRNTHYRITVLNGPAAAAVVQGGAHFPEPTYVCLQGARGIGSAVRVGWIGIGLSLEIADGPRHVVTSPVRSIALEDIPQAQRDFWRIS